LLGKIEGRQIKGVDLIWQGCDTIAEGVTNKMPLTREYRIRVLTLSVGVGEKAFGGRF